MGNSKKVVLGGIGYVTYYFNRLAKALYIHFVLSIILLTITLIPEMPIAFIGLAAILVWIPTTLIAITTHKIILEGPTTIPERGLFEFKIRELKFVGYGILIGVIILPAIVFAFIPFVGVYIFIITASVIASRLSLVFPAIAIGREMGIKESWNATSSHKLMMFAAVIVFPTVIGLIEYLIELIPVVGIVSEFLSLFTTVFVVATLSVAYKIVFEESSDR